MIKTIIFDFDGVIAESVNVKGEAFRDLYQGYGENVANKVMFHHMKNGGVSRYEKFKIWHKEFLEIELSENEIKKLAQDFSNLVVEKVVESSLVIGVEDFLKENKNHYDFYIVSATPESEICEIVERMGLKRYFRKILGSPSTKTCLINELSKNNEIQISNTVFIGDSISDFKAAMNTGARFILREVEYNQGVFKDYVGLRISNFVNFNKFLLSI